VRVSIKGYDLFYRAIGSGIPVVAFHGYTIDHRAICASHESVFQNR